MWRACSCTRLVLLLAVLWLPTDAAGQEVPPKGGAATLDVATWNIEWFGHPDRGPADDAGQFDHVRAVIEQSGIDLWALQEIADTGDFYRLIDSLGTPFTGILGSSEYDQRTAFIFRRDVMDGSAKSILTGFGYEFAGRPPLQFDATVTLPDTTVEVSFVTLHMKCCGGGKDYERREEAARRLKLRIDYGADLHEKAVIVLGDFNDELERSISGGRVSPFEAFLADDEDYRFVTLPLDEQNVATYLGAGSTIDHILITDELFSAYEESSAAPYSELLDVFYGYAATTSDHLPVYARFDFATGTFVDRGVLPAVASLGSPFPNPFADYATLSFTLSRPSEVRLEVFDMLGRSVDVAADGHHAAGTHRVRLNGRSMPAGVYLVRFRAEGTSSTRRLVRQ